MNMKNPQKANIEQEICSICLEQMGSLEQNDANIRQLPCKHCFHEKCTADLITNNLNLCPICRIPFYEKKKTELEPIYLAFLALLALEIEIEMEMEMLESMEILESMERLESMPSPAPDQDSTFLISQLDCFDREQVVQALIQNDGNIMDALTELTMQEF